MSETARAVARERTITIMEYVGFRPSWSSNMELILHWDVCDQVLGKLNDIQMLLVSGRFGHASLAGPDSLKYGIYREYTFGWNQIGANNVFRLRWDVCG